jgi:hypothetical protein
VYIINKSDDPALADAEVVVEPQWADGMSDCSGGGNGATE